MLWNTHVPKEFLPNGIRGQIILETQSIFLGVIGTLVFSVSVRDSL